MPATKYTYSISQDFPGGQVNFDNLHAEVAAWAAGLSQPKVLLRVDSEEDVIDFWFSDALTPQDQLGLDGGTTNPAGGVIATHDNTITAEGESVVFDENGLVPREDLPVLAGATLSLPGDQGVVPAPQAGDHLKYLRGDGTWQDVDVSGAVQSVNGETGTVVLDSADVGADPAGTASSAVAAHEAAGDPHPQYTTAAEAANAAPVQSVNGEIGVVSLDAADVGADPAGTASNAVAAHEAAGDPHPQYTTAVEAAAAAPVQSVNGEIGDVSLDAADVGADPAGTASSAVAAHEGALDPHPQYTTAAEAAAAAPVQSVNGETGVVALAAADVGADPAGTASSAVAAHEAALDPHPGYQRESEKDQANGYAGLTAALKVAASQLQEVIALADLTDVAAKTGTGTTVVMQGSPTLTTPTIGDFTNAPHSHQNAAGGGTLDASAIAAGTLARARLPSQLAYEDEANAFTGANDFSGTLMAPRKTTPVAPATGEVYVDGADLKYRDAQGSPANQTVERQSRRGAANGYGSLDGSSQQPLSELKQMSGATSGSAGSRGSVPQPLAGDQRKFLRGDGTWADLVQNYASASALTTTTSGTDVAIPGLSITPEAGTYLVWLNGDFTNTSKNSDVVISIYANGTQAADSERFLGVSTKNRRRVGSTIARVTVNGSQAIQGRWRVGNGTGEARQRALMILKVA